MNWKSAIEKPEPYKTVLLRLTGRSFHYTTGWWADQNGKGRRRLEAPGGVWVGLAFNQSPPTYELEAGSVECWCEIEPPAGEGVRDESNLFFLVV